MAHCWTEGFSCGLFSAFGFQLRGNKNMSGRRQHYLPQFLQRKFAHRRSGDNSYVHVHYVDKYFVSSTSGVGVEKDFYSGPEDTSIDDHVTIAEKGPVETLSRIFKKNYVDQSDGVAELMGFLSIRTLKMREAMRDVAPVFIEGIRRLSSEDDIVRAILEEKISDRQWILKQVDDVARQNGIKDRNNIALARSLFMSRLQAEMLSRKNEMIETLNRSLFALIDNLEAKAAVIADDAFLRVLKNSDSMSNRFSMFSGFNYSLVHSNGGEFILGDCAVVATNSLGNACLALADSDNDVRLECLYLPICKDKMIFGSRDPAARPLGADEVNHLSSSLSARFFISHCSPSESTFCLRKNIGLNSGIDFDLEKMLLSARESA